MPDPSLPRFFGGAVGFMGFDVVRFFEELPAREKPGLDIPDMFFMITDTLVVFDNVTHLIKVVSNAHVQGQVGRGCIQRGNGEDQRAGQETQDGARRQRLRGQGKEKIKEHSLTSNFTQPQYEQAVLKAKEYIKAGDIFQVVPSQRFETKITVEPFEIYRALRLINPSPYMFFLRCGDTTVVGASPEIMVRLEGDGSTSGRSRARAGAARPRKRTALGRELLADPKERAEHIMLVDLAATTSAGWRAGQRAGHRAAW